MPQRCSPNLHCLHNRYESGGRETLLLLHKVSKVDEALQSSSIFQPQTHTQSENLAWTVLYLFWLTQSLTTIGAVC